MKVILGGGLAALLARDILGPSWQVLPIGRSRFFSFQPPLADNYVIKDKVIDDYMSQHTVIPVYVNTAFSIAGQLTHNHHIALDSWLQKVYGDDIPPQAPGYYKSHLEYFTYGDCLDIYRVLQERYKKEIIDNDTKWKRPKQIKDHTVVTEATTFEYDEIINTIPLYSLLELLGCPKDLPARDIWYYHLATESLDFEGSSNVFVCDPEIDFFRVVQLGKLSYVIYSAKEILRPGQYLMAYIKDFELIAETTVQKAIPCGPVPDLQVVKDADITCMGSTAVWDSCLDIGSVIIRLLRYGSERPIGKDYAK